MTAHLATLLQDALGSGFRLEHELEPGGMSRLFAATDLQLGRRVVVKVLTPEFDTPTSIARFKREIELTVRLQHPHILPILSSGAWEDGLFYVTPFIPGESLRARIAREGKLSLTDLLRILADASGALAFAHAHSVVHRDVKPSNILLAEGRAILADFGIARAVTTTATPVTGSGMRPGTPAYMAPELPTDERADVYALGLVGCEMFCGALPERGARAADLIAARGRVPGDSRSLLRQTARILARAISTAPERRAWTSAEFEAAILSLPRSAPRWPIWSIAVAAVALVIAGLWASRSRQASAPPDSGNPLLVLPFSVAIAADSGMAAVATRRVRDALLEWREDTLVDDGRLREAMAGAARPPLQLSEALRLARALGAKSLVWGHVAQSGKQATVNATLYAVAAGTPIQTRTVTFAPESEASAVIGARRLVSGLLRSSEELPWRNATDRRQASLVAWRRYDEGRAAINRWDLAGAERVLRAAIDASPELAQAHLWLAQTLYWRLEPSFREQRRTAAQRALALRETLSARDSLLAQALGMLTDAKFPAACDAYRSMVRRDSADVVGWLGVSDCQARDAAVVPDAKSPSGWRFRASFADAERAMLRASYIAPATMDPAIRPWIIGRLRGIVEVSELRYGAPVGGGDPMYARPYLDHDTLVFVPYTAALIASGRVDPRPSARDSAFDHSHAVMRRAAEQWVTRAPNDGAAWVEMARVAETSGMPTIDGRQYAVVDIVKRARALERDTIAQLGLVTFHVRLLLKQGEFAPAAALADSALRGPAGRHPEVDGVAGLAALLGHADQAATLFAHGTSDQFSIQLPDGRTVSGAPPVIEAGRRLLAYAAMGAPSDSVRVAAERIAPVLAAYVSDPQMRADMRAAILMQALSLMFPDGADAFVAATLREFSRAPTLRVRAQLSLAAGDPVTARARLDSLWRQRAKAVAGAPAMDGVDRRAVLALALGDTAAAIGELDRALLALPSLGTRVLTEVPQVAALVRAMALRADLAHLAGDTPTAEHWADAVVSLWRGADPSLQLVVNRMRSYAHQR